MKLELTLPSHPGFLFFLPGLDLLALLLALVTVGGTLSRETLVEIDLPPSDLQGQTLENENPVIVFLRSGNTPTPWQISRQPVTSANLREAIRLAAEEKKTPFVVLKADQETPLRLQQETLDAISSLGLQPFLAVKSDPPAARAKPTE